MEKNCQKLDSYQNKNNDNFHISFQSRITASVTLQNFIVFIKMTYKLSLPLRRRFTRNLGILTDFADVVRGRDRCQRVGRGIFYRLDLFFSIEMWENLTRTTPNSLIVLNIFLRITTDPIFHRIEHFSGRISHDKNTQFRRSKTFFPTSIFHGLVISRKLLIRSTSELLRSIFFCLSKNTLWTKKTKQDFRMSFSRKAYRYRISHFPNQCTKLTIVINFQSETPFPCRYETFF